MRGYFQANSPFDKHSVGAAFVVEFPFSGWVCQWKAFWIPVGESFQKAYLEEWIYRAQATKATSPKQNYAMMPSPSHAKSSVNVQTIKVVIMRHGSTWISSTGATLVHSMVNMIDEFSSKNVLPHLNKGRRRGGPVIL